jgi:hypothetical protein
MFALALLLNSGAASAEIFKNLKVGGAFDFQAVSARNTLDFDTQRPDRIGNVWARVLLDMNWDLLDDMHGVVTLRKNDRPWATTGDTGQQATGDQAIGAIGHMGPDILGNVYVTQAYLKVDKMAGQFDAKIGRQYYGEPGDLIIYYGPKHNYGMWATSVDAFRVDYANDAFGLTGIAAKTAWPNYTRFIINATTSSQTNVIGLNLDVKNLPGTKLNPFIYYKETTGTNDLLWVYGVKAKVEAAGAWVNGQVALNSGHDRADTVINPSGGTTAVPMNYSGKALLVDAGYKADIANVGAFTPWLNFGIGSGRMSNRQNKQQGFKSIASDYTPGIINGRFNAGASSDLMTNWNIGGAGTSVSTEGLDNRVVFGLGVKATPAQMEKLVASLSFWNYKFQTATDGDANFNDGNGAGCKSKNIGSEVGLTLDWKHSENVTYGVGYAHFMPGGYIRNLNTKNRYALSPARLLFADMSLKF